MNDNTQDYQLPRKLEQGIASLSMFFAKRNESLLQKLLINSRYYVVEATSYDNWDGGQTGHSVVFQVPSPIYHDILDDLGSVAERIQEGLNKLISVPHEVICDVSLEIADDPLLANWREKSGLLLPRSPLQVPSSDEDLKRLWEPGFLRLFLSHKSQYKAQTAELKRRLRHYGISCFVAHEDIEPTREWQDEIERALFSMDALVVLLTEDFHQSNWTDQEIGVGIGRGVPIIPVRLGRDPYGFIGKYQAVNAKGKKPSEFAQELLRLLLSRPELSETVDEALITGFEQAGGFNQANLLVDIMNEHFKTASPELIARIETAFRTNPQVSGAYQVQGKLPGLLRRLRGS
jgi:hypothetical protein